MLSKQGKITRNEYDQSKAITLKVQPVGGPVDAVWDWGSFNRDRVFLWHKTPKAAINKFTPSNDLIRDLLSLISNSLKVGELGEDDKTDR